MRLSGVSQRIRSAQKPKCFLLGHVSVPAEDRSSREYNQKHQQPLCAILTISTASTEKYFQESLDSLKVNLSDEQLGEIDRVGMKSAIKRRYALNVFPNGSVADVRVNGKL
jgi:hypothetical protein